MDSLFVLVPLECNGYRTDFLGQEYFKFDMEGYWFAVRYDLTFVRELHQASPVLMPVRSDLFQGILAYVKRGLGRLVHERSQVHHYLVIM